MFKIKRNSIFLVSSLTGAKSKLGSYFMCQCLSIIPLKEESNLLLFD